MIRTPLSPSFGRCTEFHLSEENDFEVVVVVEKGDWYKEVVKLLYRLLQGLQARETVKHQRVNGISLKICVRTFAQRKVSTQSKLERRITLKPSGAWRTGFRRNSGF